MEHPIMFLNLLFQNLGLPIVHDFGEAHTFLEKLLLPYVTYTWLIIIALVIVVKLTVRRIELVPKGGQNFFEILISGIEEFMVGLSNYMGMIPGFFGPTANVNTTLACAIIVVFYTHVIGVKFHGPAYIKHFMGPIWWLAPLIFVVEVIGHFARVLSLSIRLFGNIFGEELVLAILMFLAGMYLAPLPMMFLGLFTGGVQAFIF